MPNLPTVKSRKRWKDAPITLFTGLVGLISTVANVVIGGGYLLCSVGLADYPHICRPSNGNYKLVIENGYMGNVAYI